MDLCKYTIAVHVPHLDALENHEADQLLADAREAIEVQCSRIIANAVGMGSDAVVRITPVED